MGLGRSKLFHAIVVAGAGMIGGCNRGPVAGAAVGGSGKDAASSQGQDATADRGDDGRLDARPDGTALFLDASPSDGAADTGLCHCIVKTGADCQICACSCGAGDVVDGGICFPCYV